MQNESEAPEEIFIWLQKHNYSQLKSDQRLIVDCYFSPEEYEDMHIAADLSSAKIQQDDISLNRSHVLKAYDDQQRYQNRIFNFSNWRMAAVVLPLIVLFVLLWYVKPIASSSISQVASTDTVYVNKEMASKTVVVHDTVYLEKKSKRTGRIPANVVQTQSMLLQEEILTGLKLEEQFNEENSMRSNNMRDDSLWSAFPAVTL